MDTVKTKTSGRPEKYKRLRDMIIVDLFNSKLNAGDFYATEQALCERFSVGRNTIRKALTEVEKLDFIIRRKRIGILAGTQVNDRESRKNYSAETIQSPPKVILLLPSWDNNAGNFYSNHVLRELRSSDNGKSWLIDARTHDDALDHVDGIEAIIAAAPDLAMCMRLRQLSQKGIRIIIIEPSMPQQTDFAINIRPTIYNAVIETIKELYALGHERIGIINRRLEHDLFRQWLQGYIQAHNELKLSIYPNAIIQIENNDDVCQAVIDVKNISAWICSFGGAINAFARTCNINHLRIPEDISVVGSDDPGNFIVPFLGSSLSVVRPDYSMLVKIIRRILQNQTDYMPGDIIELPTTKISRGSVGRKK